MSVHDGAERWFASDNNASVHPRIMEALERANRGHALGYGDDPVSARVRALFKGIFGQGSETFLVWNGTGANVMALAAALRPWEGVICTEEAHIATDEAGAPERVAGIKIFTVPSPDGKLSPAMVRQRLSGLGWVHANLPRMVSISQPTETGLVYSLEELDALGALCREKGLLLHVDGARLSNAAVALGVGLAEAAGPADILSFGGAKNGLMFGEAVVFINGSLASGAANLRKNVLQLASKMRFISAQFEAYLSEGIWKENAQRANASAKALEAAALKAGLRLAYPVQANGVFVYLPLEVIEPLVRRSFFYVMDSATGLARWMCSWDTEPEDIENLARALAELLPRR